MKFIIAFWLDFEVIFVKFLQILHLVLKLSSGSAIVQHKKHFSCPHSSSTVWEVISPVLRASLQEGQCSSSIKGLEEFSEFFLYLKLCILFGDCS